MVLGLSEATPPQEKTKGGPRFSMTRYWKHVRLTPVRISFCLRWESAVSKTGAINLGWILDSLEELLIKSPHHSCTWTNKMNLEA